MKHALQCTGGGGRGNIQWLACMSIVCVSGIMPYADIAECVLNAHRTGNESGDTHISVICPKHL